MRQSFLRLAILLGFSFWIDTISGQTPNDSLLTQPARLNRLATQTTRTFRQSYQKALRLAHRYQWPIFETTHTGRYLSLQGVTETGQPIYYITDNNVRAAATTRTSQLWSGGRLGLALTGSTTALQGKLGIWDGGWVSNTHQELQGRVRTHDEAPPNASESVSTHATHVAGTLMAAGVEPIARGMAYRFSGLQSYNFTNDVAEMAKAAPDLLISNHSYGELVGWRLNTSRSGNVQWEWNGDIQVSTTEDYRFGFYDAETRLWDEICYYAPYYLPVKSAGNNRDENGPAVGLPYYRRNQNGGYSYVSARSAEMSSNNGYDNIPTYGIAKNVLTVGAVTALADGSNQSSDVRIASFSSWGPSDDGRIKPDLVANGVDVLSCISTTDEAYSALSGTSMATPNVAGSLLLLQEYFWQRYRRFMRSATVKALAIHTTDEAGDAPGPDYRFGWGLLNTEKAAQVIGNVGTSHHLSEQVLNNGQTYELTVTASGKGPLLVTLAWTDPPATARKAAAENLNNRAPLLVNDLDIRVRDAVTEYRPWVLDPAKPAAAATHGDNFRDNVENIRIENPVPGKAYTIRLSHKGSLVDQKQAYSLIVSGIGGTTYCTSQAQTQADGRIEAVMFGGLQSMSATDCASYTDFTNRMASVSRGQVIPLSVTVGSCGNSIAQIVKTYADWNNDGDFADENETLAVSDVLSGNATFRTNVTIPNTLVIGNTVRLRVVCAATTNAADVQPCGSSGKGETEDYLLTVVRPADDIAITEVSLPVPELCADAQPIVQVKVKNLGVRTQRAIPVEVQILEEDKPVAMLTGTVNDSLQAFEERILTLTGDFRYRPDTQYTFAALAKLASDPDSTNNRFRLQQKSPAWGGEPWKATAVTCDDQVLLSADNVSGTAYWYASATATQPIAAGNSTSGILKTPDDVYYAALNDFSGTIGPADKKAFAGGSYGGNFGPQPLLTTFVPLVIQKARLYIGHAGKITFTVYKHNGLPVSSVTLAVRATRNPAVPEGNVSNQQADDLLDEGQMYDLNLAIPEPGQYKIGIAYAEGATIFRSNQGVIPYPYRLPHILQLTGAEFNSAILTNAYYYLYDIQVQSIGCAGPRVAVKAQAPTGNRPTAVIESDGNICMGEKATLTIQLTGTPPWHLVYRHESKEYALTNIKTPVYRFASELTGTYQIVALGDATHCLLPQSGPAAVVAYNPPADTTLNVTGAQLKATEAAAYRWFLNGTLLDTATHQTLIARKVGNYRVEITSKNGCKGLSREVEITQAATEDVLTGGWLRISPNPTAEQVTVYMGDSHTVTRLQLFNSSGKLLRQIAIPDNLPSIDLAVSSYAPGLYTLVLQNSTRRQAYKFVKM